MSSGNRGYRKRPYYNKFNGGYNNNYYYGGYKKKYYKYKNYQNEEEIMYLQMKTMKIILKK